MEIQRIKTRESIEWPAFERTGTNKLPAALKEKRINILYALIDPAMKALWFSIERYKNDNSITFRLINSQESAEFSPEAARKSLDDALTQLKEFGIEESISYAGVQERPASGVLEATRVAIINIKID
ncbi:MAG: hypothetical protein ACI9QC_000913 [Oceanicoccus sp.]|jgi:hypothetical protein